VVVEDEQAHPPANRASAGAVLSGVASSRALAA
jgi:hypothetical protein